MKIELYDPWEDKNISISPNTKKAVRIVKYWIDEFNFNPENILPSNLIYDKDSQTIKKIGKRKQTDYQWSELIVALCLLCDIDLDILSYDYLKTLIYKFHNKNKLYCKKEILDKYLEDLQISQLKEIKKYIQNFNINEDKNNIIKVWLTGKSYSDYPELIELNQNFKEKKPNSDIYFELIK